MRVQINGDAFERMLRHTLNAYLAHLDDEGYAPDTLDIARYQVEAFIDFVAGRQRRRKQGTTP